MQKDNARPCIIALLIACTLFKLILAARWGWTAEIMQMQNQAAAFLGGGDFLDPQTTRGNPSFFPLGHYLLVTSCWLLANATGLAFSFVIKTPAILADLAISFILLAMPRGGGRAALIYMANPMSFLLSVYHGQPHTVAVAGALFAVWAAQAERWPISGLLLALAASIRQHFAVLLAPLAMKAGKRFGALLWAFTLVAVPLNLPLFFSAHPGRILAPTWTFGSWGYSMILLQAPRVLALCGMGAFVPGLEALNGFLESRGSAFYWVWAAVYAAWAWKRGGTDLCRDALIFFLGVYVISPGFGIQWLIWALPFWLIVDRREAVGYSVIAGSFLAGSYWQWSLNAKYGVRSLTANLGVLTRADLLGVMLVGLLVVSTWLYCAKAAWRLIRA